MSEHDDNRSESSEASESDHDSVNDECDSDASDSEGEDESAEYVILAFIVADMEDVDERPVATRS